MFIQGAICAFVSLKPSSTRMGNLYRIACSLLRPLANQLKVFQAPNLGTDQFLLGDSYGTFESPFFESLHRSKR